MLKKLSCKFLILFLISVICLNTYSYTSTEAADVATYTAINYFVDFAVSYLGYDFDKTDRLDIANQLIKKYKEINGSITNLMNTARKTLFLSLCKSYTFLKDKVKEFETELKSCISLVADIVLNKIKSYSDTPTISTTQSLDFNNMLLSDWISVDMGKSTLTYRLGIFSSQEVLGEALRSANFYDSGVYKTDSVLYASHFPMVSKILKDNDASFHFSIRKDFYGYNSKCFYISDKYNNLYFNSNDGNDDSIYFFSDDYLKLYKYYCQYIKNGKIYSQVYYSKYTMDSTLEDQNEVRYLYNNDIYQNSNFFRDLNLKSLSDSLNTSSEIKSIANSVNLQGLDYNKVVDLVLSKVKNSDNLALDKTNNQVLNYASDNVINREIDDKKVLTGSDIINLNVDKLLDRSISIDKNLEANNTILKTIYDVVSNSRESILKLATDIALTNTTAINLARDLADIKAKTDVITSDTYADTLSDKISTSVSKSIGNTISSTLDNKFGNKDNKHINLDPLKNLIIKEKFPFSLPFDLKDTLTLMKSKQIIANFDLNIRGYHMKIDFSMFDSLVKKARPFFLLMFCVFLVLVSKKVLS